MYLEQGVQFGLVVFVFFGFFGEGVECWGFFQFYVYVQVEQVQWVGYQEWNVLVLVQYLFVIQQYVQCGDCIGVGDVVVQCVEFQLVVYQVVVVVSGIFGDEGGCVFIFVICGKVLYYVCQ